MKLITYNNLVLLFTVNSVYSIRFPGLTRLVDWFNQRKLKSYSDKVRSLNPILYMPMDEEEE